jgi:hypothetical protein
MQEHERHDPPDPEPKRPDPKDVQTRLLLFVIGALLAVIAGRLLGRLF